MNDNANSSNTASQVASIRRHLEAGKTITALEALSAFSCFRLAARINDLSNAGLLIESRPITVISADGKRARVAQYSMREVL